eukprot:973068-Pyramimonas_sp.AAC.2
MTYVTGLASQVMALNPPYGPSTPHYARSWSLPPGLGRFVAAASAARRVRTHQSRKGRENIPVAGTNCRRGERIYP